ncbi:MAG: imidazole glycerol phosphate synthase subunit HisH [Rhodospirillales bacterium]|nr:imidazole glycerol phosphate synthase subunit HisH [Rhodospirillales bacterium]
MSKETIVIIDYGSGNLRSAAKAFEYVIANEAINAEVLVSAHPGDVLRADRIVLPGQGAFGDCMDNLKGTDGMIEALEQRVQKDARPFLGICVGMQLLATRGLEHGVHAGLNWVPGQVVPLAERINDPSLKIPHMGWNELVPPHSGEQDNRHFVLRSTESSGQGGDHYYFVHSFMFECEYNHHVLGLADYGGLFAAVVGRDNIAGVQFHPEKSQDAGLRLIGDFIRWKP